jgi:hypothetical protein
LCGREHLGPLVSIKIAQNISDYSRVQMDLHNLQKRIQELRREMSDLVAIDKGNRTRNSFVGRQHQMEHQARLTANSANQGGTWGPRAKTDREIVNPSLSR